jgi:hypothetical protein
MAGNRACHENKEDAKQYSGIEMTMYIMKIHKCPKENKHNA